MNFIAAGLPLKIVALLDVSKTADAMISDGSVTDIKGLKGKQVAYEEGTTSDILLNYALSQNGMTIADIEKVPMPASDAGAALIGGKVPVAVTYEPYLTLAMNQNPKVKMVYSAGENPGLISDVFVVREEFLKEKPGQVVALLKAWDLALADYRKDTAGGRAIISEAIGAKPEELATAFDGVVYYSLAENKTELGGNFTSKVIPEVHAAARTAGILQKDVDSEHGNRRPVRGCRNQVRWHDDASPWVVESQRRSFWGFQPLSSPFWRLPGLPSQREDLSSRFFCRRPARYCRGLANCGRRDSFSLISASASIVLRMVFLFRPLLRCPSVS